MPFIPCLMLPPAPLFLLNLVWSFSRRPPPQTIVFLHNIYPCRLLNEPAVVGLGNLETTVDSGARERERGKYISSSQQTSVLYGCTVAVQRILNIVQGSGSI